MAGFIACPGSGERAVEVTFYPAQRGSGWDASRAVTFGECSACGYKVREYGDARQTLTVPRHKSRLNS